MGNIIEQGSFQSYAQIRLDEARSSINEYSQYTRKTTVFVSHKHDELQELKGVLGFLQTQYGVKTYIGQSRSYHAKTYICNNRDKPKRAY